MAAVFIMFRVTAELMAPVKKSALSCKMTCSTLRWPTDGLVSVSSLSTLSWRPQQPAGRVDLGRRHLHRVLLHLGHGRVGAGEA